MIQAIQEMKRAQEIATLCVKHGLGDKLNLAKLKEVLGLKEDVEVAPEVAQRTGPERFRCFLTELGTTFIKFGQILSTRVDLLPPEYIQELSKLQDDVPPVPFESIRAQVESSLGAPISSLFQSFEETPLAAASIAQVHRAVTPDGRKVVVKIQRPLIADKISADILLLKKLAHTAEAVFQESEVYSPIELVNAFEESIRKELDATLERDNLLEFSRRHEGRKNIVVPKPVMELCSSTVVTMDMVVGKKLRDVSSMSPAEKKAMSDILVEETYQEMFLDGIFHGDPHPGNLLFIPGENGPCLGIIDLGCVGRMNSQMQENLLFLLVAIALKDGDTVTRLICRIAGSRSQRTDMMAFRGDVQALLDRYLSDEMTLDSINSSQLIPELLSMAARYHIRIPRDYTLLGRSAVILEGVIQSLTPGLNLATTLMPYARRTIANRYEGADAGLTGMKALLRMQTLATDLPMQFSQILMDMHQGKFQISVTSEELRQINTTLKGLGIVVFLGFLACGLTIGIFLSIAKMNTIVMGLPIPAVLSLVGIGILFGIVLAWTLYSGHGFRLKLADVIQRAKPSKQQPAHPQGIPQSAGPSGRDTILPEVVPATGAAERHDQRG